MTFYGGTTLVVTDSEGAERASLNITISGGGTGNRNPTANAGGSQVVGAGTMVTLVGVGTDPDNDALAYRWSQVSGATVTLAGANSHTASFTPAAADVYVFRLSVSDGKGGVGTADVKVTVGASTNVKPVASAGSSQYGVGYNRTVTLNGAGSVDPDGGALTYAWTQAASDRLQVTLSGVTSATPSFVSPGIPEAFSAAQMPIPTAYGVLAIPSFAGVPCNFKLTVQDPQGLTATSSVETVSQFATDSTTNVAVGRAVYFNTDNVAGPWDWTLVSKPSDSSAKLVNVTSRFPSLVPDVKGPYQIRDSVKPILTINAGTYVGMGGSIVGGNTAGNCNLCHGSQVTSYNQTFHAQKMKFHLDGLRGTSYRAYCLRCHSVGFDLAPSASNNGFDDLLVSTGWTIPTTQKSGGYDTMPADLKALANIQCENCHGPGSDHFGNKQKIAKSLSVETCAQCHRSQPAEWYTSTKHKAPVVGPTGWGTTRSPCAGCHSGLGYISYAESLSTTGDISLVGGYPPGVLPSGYQPFTCAVCHDPHKTATPAPGTGSTFGINDHQLRLWNRDIKLIDGTRLSNTGASATCIACHHSRRMSNVVDTYATGRTGAHYGTQADMLVGVNGYNIPGWSFSSSAHTTAIADRCVQCHMAEPSPKSASQVAEAGGHTLRMRKADRTPNASVACGSCHAGLTTFDRPPTGGAKDYDGNGKADGVQTEVAGLLKLIDETMRQVNSAGWTRYLTSSQAGDLTVSQRRVAWNYFFVSDDGSLGIHNPAYAIQLLQRSYREIAGQEIPGAFVWPMPFVAPPASLDIGNASIVPDTVPAGGTFTVSLPVRNSGNQSATVTSAAVTFSVTGISAPPLSPSLTSVAPGATTTLLFQGSVAADATPGVATVSATIGAGAASAFRTGVGSLTVYVAAPALSVEAVTSTTAVVRRADSDRRLSVMVKNTGTATALQVAVTVLPGVSGGFTFTPWGTNPTSIAAGARTIFDFRAAVSPTAPLGTVTLNALADAPGASTATNAPGDALIWQVTYAGANMRPVASAGPPQYGVGYVRTVTLNGTGSADPEGGALTYMWTQAASDKLKVTLSGVTSSAPSFVSPGIPEAFSAAQMPIPTAYGVLAIPNIAGVQCNFRLTVQDPQGLTATSSVETVSQFATDGTTNVAVGRTVHFNTDNVAGPWDWTLVSKPSGSSATLVNVTSRFPSLVPDVKGPYQIRDSGKPILTINAGTYVGMGGSIVGGNTAGNCNLCHGSQVTSYNQTFHAQKMKFHLDGLRGTNYGASCLRCHSVGLDLAPSASNNGFDDLLVSTGWTIPTTQRSGGYDTMPASLKALANIQCENCHGPGSDHFGDKQKIGKSLSVEVCAQCHRGQPAEWYQTKHATPFINAAIRPSCAGCHSGLGYISVTDQLQTTDTIVLVNSYPSSGPTAPATGPVPLNCAVCHDPHKTTTPAPETGLTTGTNDHQLRLWNQNMKLIDGTVITGTGAAASCIQCHHARRLPATSSATRFTAHYGVQADMLAGVNGFQVAGQTYSSSFHMTVENKCVGCHMAKNTTGRTIDQVGDHTLSMTSKDGKTNNAALACGSCHSGLTSYDRPPTGGAMDYDGNGTAEGVQTEVMGLLTLIDTRMRVVNSAGWTRFVTSENATSLTTASDISEAAQKMAAWNYTFVHDDGSRGVHNTAYTVQLLQRTYKEINGGTDIPNAYIRP